MPSTNKTNRLKLSQLISIDAFKFLTDYNNDMLKLDEHTHVVVSDSRPSTMYTNGSEIWYNPTRNLFYHCIGGSWKPLVDVITSLDSLDTEKPLAASVGEQLKGLVDLKSSIFKSDMSNGVEPTPTNFIFRVSASQGNSNGFTDNIQVSPNMGLRILNEDESSKVGEDNDTRG